MLFVCLFSGGDEDDANTAGDSQAASEMITAMCPEN